MTKQMKALQTRIGKLQTKKEVLVNPVSNTETSGEPEDAY